MNTEGDHSSGVKYTLRAKSLLKRMESEKSRHEERKVRDQKEKSKPAPLSKYRRRTANARERNRMKEINDAFMSLQQTLPNLPGTDAEKLTKITVLKLAVDYIKALSCFLDGGFIGGHSDIDDVKNMWSISNAHLAKAGHCVRTVMKQTKSPTGLDVPCKTLSLQCKKNRPKPKMAALQSKLDTSKENQAVVTKCLSKRSRKAPRSKMRVCKTASVITNNGAYITLKNVAFQTIHRPNRVPDNEPLMMSMTVKRPRLELVNSYRPKKFSKLDPLVAVSGAPPTVTPCSLPSSQVSTPFHNRNSNENSSFGLDYYLPKQDYPQISSMPSFSALQVQDVNQTTKSEPFAEFPVLTDLPASFASGPEFTFNESSEPSSPSYSTSPSCTTPLGHVSPSDSTGSFSSGVFSYNGSENDPSGDAQLVDFGSLLNQDPFEDDLDTLTSSITDECDSLKLLFDGASSNFICSDLSDC